MSKMIRRTNGYILLLLCLLVFIPMALAQNESSNHEGLKNVEESWGVPDGEYYDLTLMRKIKFGTAPFFNPHLAQMARVAYKFDADEINIQAWEGDLNQLYDAGLIGVAIVHNNDESYETVEALNFEEALDKAFGVGQKAVLLASSEQLLDGYKTDPHIKPQRVIVWKPRGLKSK